MWFLWRISGQLKYLMMKVQWTAKISNDAILEQANNKKD
jgi:hypothetical protein